jgi:hypothetical protein
MVTQNEQVLITMPIRDMVVSVVMLLSKLKKKCYHARKWREAVLHH